MPSARLPEFLRALARPFETFDSWSPSLGRSAAAVVLVAVVCALGVGASAGVAGEHVGATIRVDNPERPSQGFCENAGTFETLHNETNHSGHSFTENCDEPKRIPFRLGPFAHGIVMGQAAVAFFAVLFAWPVAAGLFHGLTEGRDGGDFGETLAYAAWGFVPAIPRYAALPLAFDAAMTSLRYPRGKAPLREFLHAALADPGVAWFGVLVAVTFAWQAYVFAGGVTATRGLTRKQAALVVGVPTAFVAIARFSALELHVPHTVSAALVVLLLGLVQMSFPYALELLDLKSDLIGTRGGGDVEPRAWRVALTRLSGVLFAVVGLWFLGGLGLVL